MQPQHGAKTITLAENCVVIVFILMKLLSNYMVCIAIVFL